MEESQSKSKVCVLEKETEQQTKIDASGKTPENQNRFFYYDKLMQTYKESKTEKKTIEAPSALETLFPQKKIAEKKDVNPVEFKEQVTEESASSSSVETEFVGEDVSDDYQTVEDITNSSAEPKKKSNNLRLRLFAIVLCVCVGCAGGLFISNAVTISNLQKSIISTKTEYSMSVYNYIKKVNKLEKFEDYISTSNKIENTSFIPIALSSEELEVLPTENKIKTNWFDRLVTKIQNFFKVK